jgi:uncharacterized protein YjbI with pentapeptide repeats
MLQHSSFINSKLFRTKFWDGYLDETNFSGANLVRTDFQGASLKRASFHQADLLIVDFTNVDLLDARGLTDETLQTVTISGETIILTNARFPNGTFGSIDSSNLVQNGKAEQEVVYDVHK